jgi:capsular polysaccharide biosynthesis protein
LRSQRILSAASETLDVEPAVLEAYEVSAVVLPEASVLELVVSGPDPGLAALLANRMGEEAITYVSELYPIHRFDFLDVAPVPQQTAGPPLIQTVAISLLLGLGLGLLLVILRERVPTQLLLVNPNWETARRNEQMAVTNGAFHDIEHATSPNEER